MSGDSFGPVPVRHEVDAATVRRLIAAQFPRWAGLPVRPVARSGWDNRTFHLGAHMLVRLPSAAEYALAVAKEQRWLPILAPRLPLPVPCPLAVGEPDEGYPHPWSVYRWIDGEPATTARVDDLTSFAVALADFLVALQRIDPVAGPAPGLHNWFRGGPLRKYEVLLSGALGRVDTLPRDAIMRIWATASRATWSGPPVWFHGDIAPGNLLVRAGRLSAVIDFGTCGVGDPACDLAIAWTFLSGASRSAFRERLAVDDATWVRGLGWALWKAVVTYAGGGSDAADARRVIGQITEECDGRAGGRSGA
jgi:aminoglycoside phosphotransferase (APT) family kinase protein